ncbi:MAG: 50S ribosomal protein L15 [Planctomycetota bacterium]|jgi:large subunit ribosomal protein L15
MMIHEITEKVGRHKSRRRVGRGESSGRGKTSGRGHKGAASRAGWKRRAGYEGGQMPLIRRMPKRGFSNVRFATEFNVINVRQLEMHCDDGTEVTAKSLAAAGVIRDPKRPLKVLADGKLTKKLHISAAKFSKAAREKIESAGGSVIEIEMTKWRRPTEKKNAKSKPKADG